jgi:hypothetical protein
VTTYSRLTANGRKGLTETPSSASRRPNQAHRSSRSDVHPGLFQGRDYDNCMRRGAGIWRELSSPVHNASSRPGDAFLDEKRVILRVPRVGVEPTTRGFSGRIRRRVNIRIETVYPRTRPRR